MATHPIARAEVLRSRDFLGRDILDAASTRIGTIRDLLLDRRTGSVRFLEVDLGMFRKQVIVPVSHVDWGEDAFILRGWTTEQIQRLPAHEADTPITAEILDELALAYPRFYGGDEPAPLADARDINVIPLRDAKGFRVRRDEPDLRGWNVFGSDGERVGKVADLLVDPAALKVAYLDVDLLDDLYRLKDDRHVLLPTEAVELRERGRDVWVLDLTADEVARLPAYVGGPVDPLVISKVADAFGASKPYSEPKRSERRSDEPRFEEEFREPERHWPDDGEPTSRRLEDEPTR